MRYLSCKFYIILFAFYFSFEFSSDLRAQAFSKNPMDLKAVISVAEKNSPLLTAMYSDLESLFFLKKQEGRTQNPFVTVDYGRRTAASEAGSEYALQVEQPIYFPGRKELKQLLVDNDSKIKEIQTREATTSIRLNAVKFAYRYLVAADKRNHVKERLKRLALIESYIKARPFFTPQAKTDLYIIETRILALKKHFNDLQLGAAKDYESINLYLMSEAVPEFKLPFFEDGVKIDFDELQKKAIHDNASILVAKGELEKARTELRMANLEKYPDYSVVSQVGEDRSGVANRFYDFGLKFRVPVWDQFQNKVASAETNLRARQDRLTHQENVIKMSFKQSFLEYEQNKENLKLYSLKRLERVDRDLNFADIEFKKGRIQLISYLELENQLHETHHAILDAQMAHVESLLNLLYITNEKDILGIFGNAIQTFEYQPK